MRATEPRRYEAGEVVSVLPLRQPAVPFDYLVPEGGVTEGAFVEVPLGRSAAFGVVWGPGSGEVARERLKPVSRILDLPPLSPVLRRFIRRMADYTMASEGAVLRLTTRAPGLFDGPGTRRLWRWSGREPARMTPARRRVLDYLAAAGPEATMSATDIARAAGVSPAVVQGLARAGVLSPVEAPRDAPFDRLDHARPGKALSPDQARAAARLREKVAAGGFGATLLYGVTGSGKTEVYLEAVAECLARGRQALVLLPEIALTSAFVARVEARFGARPAEWHSGVGGAARRRVWRMVAEGGAELVVGARSALFLPFRDLGLIVVDEEHDPSYKQEEGVIYHARDMAVLRASLEGAQIVLASATPSLESWVNAEAGKYERLDLPRRFGAAVLPKMQAVDMRHEALPATRWISPTLARAVEERLACGEQALLFLNRRGYAPLTLCRACGHQIGCRHCDARMVAHRLRGEMMCHQCGHAMPLPTACPACGAEERLAPIGPGIERLAEEAAALFPEARIALLSSDMALSPAALEAEIERIARGGADIVIGTQMVAKGHNFPLLTLIGVIDVDLGLEGGDLRAAERSFQLVRQVAGRAGRAERPGLALIQTHQPAHPVVQAMLADDPEAFWRAEAAQRRAAGMPPFGRLAGIILSGPDAEEVMDAGRALAAAARPLRAAGIALYGPAPAPIARIRGRHRVRLLAQAPRGVRIQPHLRRWLASVRRPASVRLVVDIDPQSFL